MATPKGTGFKWDAESERDLFGACLVVLGEPKGKTLAEAHKLLQELRGVTYTTKAATHRMLDTCAQLNALLDHLGLFYPRSFPVGGLQHCFSCFLYLSHVVSNRSY